MKTFKQETFDNIQYYLQKQKELGMYIKVIFQTKGPSLNIMVRNNVEISRKEQIRVFDRLARSRAFTSLEEAFATVLDSSEGAGLGIVILVLMMKKIGLTEDCFSIDSEDGETVASLTDPVLRDPPGAAGDPHADHRQGDRDPPAVPRQHREPPEAHRGPERRDHRRSPARSASTPRMTADLLKLVNSAQFMLPKRVDNIVEAVKLVGTKGVRNLLYSYGTQKIMGEKYSEMRSLWQHSYRCAFYAYYIAKSFKKRKELLDDVYVGAILHDLGQIVIASLHPDLLERITKVCKDKGIPARMLENFSVGLNHAEVGALIAKKWNFPEQLVYAIRFHHEPTQAPAAARGTSCTACTSPTRSATSSGSASASTRSRRAVLQGLRHRDRRTARRGSRRSSPRSSTTSARSSSRARSAAAPGTARRRRLDRPRRYIVVFIYNNAWREVNGGNDLHDPDAAGTARWRRSSSGPSTSRSRSTTSPRTSARRRRWSASPGRWASP